MCGSNEADHAAVIVRPNEDWNRFKEIVSDSWGFCFSCELSEIPDSLRAIQSGNGVSVCDVDISFESESLLTTFVGVHSSSMNFFGVVVICVWDNVWLSLLDVLRMVWLLSSSNKMMFLFSSLCGWAIVSLDVAVSIAISDGEWMCSSAVVIDDGVSFIKGLKRFWPLPGVYGVVVNCEFCFGGDEPVRSKSAKCEYRTNELAIVTLNEHSAQCAHMNALTIHNESKLIRKIVIHNSMPLAYRPMN